MPTRSEIVEQLARGRIVEQICVNIARNPLQSHNLEDLAQMVYVILLTYDEQKIVEMYQRGELRFFIARVVQNQYRSTYSPFYRQYREFGNHIDDSEDIDIENL